MSFYINILFLLVFLPFAEVCAEGKILEDHVQQAIAQGRTDNFLEAASLMKEALIDYRNIHINKHPDRDVSNYRSYRGYLRLLAYYQFQSGELLEAEETLRQIFASEGYRKTALEEEFNLVLTRDLFFLWNVMMRLDKAEVANALLKQELAEAERASQRCYVSFAHFLLGKIEESQFRTNIQEEQKLCIHFASATKALASFWIAQKAFLEKDTARARSNLLLFLSDSTKEDTLERGVAFKQLGIPLEKRKEYMRAPQASAEECACALSYQYDQEKE